MQASEVKHGFASKSEDSRKQDSNKWRRRDVNGKSGKSFRANREDENNNSRNDSGRKEKPCGEEHTIDKCKVFEGWSMTNFTTT